MNVICSWRRTILLASLTILFATCKPAAEKELTNCPQQGLAELGTPEAEANMVRNSIPTEKPLQPEITFDDIEKLQKLMDRNHVLQGIALEHRAATLGKLVDGHARPNEGRVVMIRGYIIGTPRVSRADPANCKFAGQENNDFTLHLGNIAGDTEFDTIIAAWTPRMRKVKKAQVQPSEKAQLEWEREQLEKLRTIALARQPIMIRVTGQLFYDSKHRVNSDQDNELQGEVRRFSLWEIHPITAIEVCREKRPADCRGASPKFEQLEGAR